MMPWTFTRTLYLRRITVHNEHDQARQVRLFFHHDLRISEHDVGDTAYYEPTRRALLHYKERRWFLMCAGRGSLGTTDAPTTELVDFGINQFATGTKRDWRRRRHLARCRKWPARR